jgi:hypothetical protein
VFFGIQRACAGVDVYRSTRLGCLGSVSSLLYVVLTGNDSVVQDAPGGSTFQSNVVQWWANGTVLPYPGLCRRWQVVSYLM